MNITKQQLKQLIKEEIEKLEKQFAKEQKRSVDEGVFGNKQTWPKGCGHRNRATCSKQVEMQAAIASIATTLNDVLNQLASLREKR